MTYTTPNRRRDRETWSDYVTKKSDDDQIIGNQVAVHATLIVDHDATTGKHAVKDASAQFDGLVYSENAAVALTNSVDDVSANQALFTGMSFYDPFNAPLNDQSRWSAGLWFPYDFWAAFWGYAPNPMNGFWSGIPICKGADASGGEAECVLVVKATIISTGPYYDFIASHAAIRRAAGSGTSHFDLCTVGGRTPAYQMRQSYSTANFRRQVPNSQLRDGTPVEGAPYARNFYDQHYQNAEAVQAAIGVRHSAGVSYPICWDELAGAKFYEPNPVDYAAADTFTVNIVGQHDGVHCAILPHAWGTGSGDPYYLTTTHTTEIAIAPCFDDRNFGTVCWQRPGLSSTGRVWTGATKIPLTLPATPTLPGAFSSSVTINRGDPVYTDPGGTPSALDLQDRNDEILVKLWGSEHQTGGLHALGLDRFTGAAPVLDAVPFTADATVGGVIHVNLGTWPGTNPIYLVGIVMDAGANGGPGSLVMLTLGGDETTAKAYIRTVVNNGVLTGTITVWRWDRV